MTYNGSVEVLLNERHLLKCKIHEIDRNLWEVLKKYRTKLEPKMYLVLKKRLYERKTLEKVGKEMGVTAERIRQLEYKGVLQLDDIINEVKTLSE